MVELLLTPRTKCMPATLAARFGPMRQVQRRVSGPAFPHHHEWSYRLNDVKTTSKSLYHMDTWWMTTSTARKMHTNTSSSPSAVRVTLRSGAQEKTSQTASGAKSRPSGDNDPGLAVGPPAENTSCIKPGLCRRGLAHMPHWGQFRCRRTADDRVHSFQLPTSIRITITMQPERALAVDSARVF